MYQLEAYCDLQSLEGIWRPIASTSDPMYWEWVLRDSPMYFLTTEKLRDIYSPYDPSSLSKLGQHGVFLKGEEACELITLYLSEKTQQSQDSGTVGDCTGMYTKLSCGPQNIPYTAKSTESKWHPKCTRPIKPLTRETLRQNHHGCLVEAPNPVIAQPTNPLSRLFPFTAQKQVSAGCPGKRDVGKEMLICNKPLRVSQEDALSYPPGIILNAIKPQAGPTASNLQHVSPCQIQVPRPSPPKDKSSSVNNRTPSRPPGFGMLNACKVPGSSMISGISKPDPHIAQNGESRFKTCNGVAQTSVQATTKYLPPHMRGN